MLKCNNCWHFSFYEHNKFHAKLRWACKKLYSLDVSIAWTLRALRSRLPHLSQGKPFIFFQSSKEYSLSKQWRPWTYAKERSVWSGPTLFAYILQKDASLIWDKFRYIWVASGSVYRAKFSFPTNNTPWVLKAPSHWEFFFKCLQRAFCYAVGSRTWRRGLLKDYTCEISSEGSKDNDKAAHAHSFAR